MTNDDTADKWPLSRPAERALKAFGLAALAVCSAVGSFREQTLATTLAGGAKGTLQVRSLMRRKMSPISRPKGFATCEPLLGVSAAREGVRRELCRRRAKERPPQRLDGRLLLSLGRRASWSRNWNWNWPTVARVARVEATGGRLRAKSAELRSLIAPNKFVSCEQCAHLASFYERSQQMPSDPLSSLAGGAVSRRDELAR